MVFQRRDFSMKSWFPEDGERWMFQVEVEGTRVTGEKRFIRYHPIYMQQHGAMRELEESSFQNVFTPYGAPAPGIAPGSKWILPVIVVKMDKEKLTVDYRHAKGGEKEEVRRMSVHVFRATFRRESTEPVNLKEGILEWTTDRRQWQAAQKIPKSGEWYILTVKVQEIREIDGKKQIKYQPLMQQQDSAPRLLDENIFKNIFEPVDGAVHEVRCGDNWFMMVEVTDYDSEEFSIWYRPITSSGGRKGGIRHLSDFIFLATFQPAK